MVVQASKLTIPDLSHSSSPTPTITSVLYEPTSLSLALMHSDSSFSLYPSFSPFSSSSLPSPQTLVPPPSSSSTFLLLRRSSKLAPDDPGSSSFWVVFLVCGPHRGDSRILLRFFVLRIGKGFARARVSCTQKDLIFDPSSGVVFDNPHGISVRLSGSINFFSLYSMSSSRVWVFAVKMLDDDNGGADGGDGVALKLMKWAVIECCRPVWSISLSFGLMVLGEENGVRIFNLMALVKGRSRKSKNSNLNVNVVNRRLPNGVIVGSEIVQNGYLEGKNDKHPISMKQKPIKLKQESNDGNSCFVALKSKHDADSKEMSMLASFKAICIQPLSPVEFVVLDSVGDLHLIYMPESTPTAASDYKFHLQHKPHVMNVRHLATFADFLMSERTLWVGDGSHTMHMIAGCDMEASLDPNDGNQSDEKILQISAVQAIFTSEKIQSVVSMASNAILILGQGSLYAYAIS